MNILEQKENVKEAPYPQTARKKLLCHYQLCRAASKVKIRSQQQIKYVRREMSEVCPPPFKIAVDNGFGVKIKQRAEQEDHAEGNAVQVRVCLVKPAGEAEQVEISRHHHRQ